MVQCLETKLMESVIDDGTLRKENEMRFNVYPVASPTYGSASSTNRLELYSTAGNFMTCLGSGSFVDGTGAETGGRYPATGVNVNLATYVKNVSFQVSVDNKYIVKKIVLKDALGMDITDLDGCSALEDIRISSGKVYGDLMFVKDCLFSNTVEIQNSQISGDIKYLPATSGIIYLTSNPNLYGNIASLGKCTSMTVIRLNNILGITGSLESLAQAQVANGRTSGTLSPQVIGTNVTYQGVKLSSHKTIRFGSSMVNPTSAETSQGWQIA